MDYRDAETHLKTETEVIYIVREKIRVGTMMRPYCGGGGGGLVVGVGCWWWLGG